MTSKERPGLPSTLLGKLSEIEWLEPWWCFCLNEPDFGQSFEDELQRELSGQHILYSDRMDARAIAKRGDRDDFLFWIPNKDQRFAIVHLTFSHSPETNPSWPRTLLLSSLAEFVEQELIPANREWLCI